jgi:hypothetical protein
LKQMRMNRIRDCIPVPCERVLFPCEIVVALRGAKK